MKPSTAYPNFSDYIQPSPMYDLSRWMEAMKNIYIKVHSGLGKTAATEEITKEWNKLERRDFEYWMRYYESKDYTKYKTAQIQSKPKYLLSNDIPNYFIPNHAPKAPEPEPDFNKIIDTVPMIAANEYKKEQDKVKKKELIELQRKKLLGRLNSVEKLLSTEDGSVFVGAELEALLVALHEIKRKIQTMNKISTSNSIYVDLIIRQANILKHSGFENPSQVLMKVAQNTPGNFNPTQGPLALPLGDKIDGTGSLDNPTPSTLGGPSQDPAAAIAPEEKPKKDAPMDMFLARLENLGLSQDTNTVEDNDEDVSVDEDVLLDQEILEDDVEEKKDKKELVSKAQATPPAPAPMPGPDTDLAAAPEAPAPTPKAVPEQAPEDVELPAAKPGDEAPAAVGENAPAGKDVDAIIDAAFANITVNDIVAKLEDVSKIFRTREVARQLTIVDLMLNKLNLASHFPSLAEIISKNLEAGNYCQTRLDDMLSRLRGTIETENIDLEGTNTQQTPETEALKAKLQDQEDKDRARKDLRKKQQEQDALEAVKPDLEVESPAEELTAQPAKVEAPAAPGPAAVPAPV